MAILYSTQAALQNTAGGYTDASKRQSGLTLGESPMLIDYTFATPSAGDLLILSRLPSGVLIDVHNSYTYNAGTADTLTVDIGVYSIPSSGLWADLTSAHIVDIDKYADGHILHTAGIETFVTTGVPIELTTPAATTEEGLLVATILATPGGTLTDKTNFVITFKHIGG